MALTTETPSCPVTIESLRQRRSSARRPLHALVEVVQPTEGTGVTINVSERGLRVAVDCPLTAGEVVLLYVRELDRPERLESARVAWVQQRPDGCIAGLEITGLH